MQFWMKLISSIQASSQTQDRKIDSLEKFCSESEKFISEVVRIDEEVAELINKRKENFYKRILLFKTGKREKRLGKKSRTA